MNAHSTKISLGLGAFLAAVVFIAITFALYAASLHGAFIWDDHFLVKDNLLIRSPVLVMEAFRHFLGYDPASNFYRPVQTLTYLLDYYRGGLEPTIYHQTNIVIHGLNGALFFTWLLLRLKKYAVVPTRKIVLLCALLTLFWLVHPIFSATVAYIAGRADSLALMFLLITGCLLETYFQSSKKWILSISLITAFLALCSKEAALAGLGFFLLSILFLESRLPKQRKINLLVCFSLPYLLYLVSRLTIVNNTDPNTFYTNWQDRPLLILRALGDYLRLLVWPQQLRMERQITLLPNLYVDPVTFDPLYPYLILPGIVFLVFLIVSYFLQGAHRPMRRFGVLWFTISILPVSNLFSLNSTVAEHWLYIPALGVLIALLGWWLEAKPKIQNAAILLLAIWVVGLSYRTAIRSRDWVSPLVFFEKTIRDGGDTARMRVNLANEYRLAGRLQEGEAQLRLVLQKSPNYYQARHALVTNLQLQGRSAEANQILNGEGDVFGDSFSGRVYALHRLIQDSKIAEAARELKVLNENYPNSWMVTKETLFFFDRIHQPENKLPILETFAAHNPWHSEAQMSLAKLYLVENRVEDALACYQQAARLDVRNAEPYQLMSELLMKNNRPEEAGVCLRKAETISKL